jgi:hypothetical protein
MDFTLKYFNVPPDLTEGSPPNTITEGQAG